MALADTVAKQANVWVRELHAPRVILRAKPIAVVAARPAEITGVHVDPQMAQTNTRTAAAASPEGSAGARSPCVRLRRRPVVPSG